MSLDVTLRAVRPVNVYDANITHNLGGMAKAAGIYKALWRPEEIEISQAGQLIPILEKGLKELTKHPVKYKRLNPPNGWGDYEGFVEFVKNYLQACRENPDAMVLANR